MIFSDLTSCARYQQAGQGTVNYLIYMIYSAHVCNVIKARESPCAMWSNLVLVSASIELSGFTSSPRIF